MDDAATIPRRLFLTRAAGGVGGMALASLLGRDARASEGPHFAPRARRVIHLFQSGGPSHLDLFDPKPALRDRRGEPLPESVRQGQRLTGMTSGQKSLSVVPSAFPFARHGRSGAWLSGLLPHTAAIADELCFVRSMQTDAINHDPAITFFQTGAQAAGRPSAGAWVSYGLGSENQDLPAFVVLVSRGTGNANDQPLYDRLWGAGFLPGRHQGVKFRSSGDPVLFLSNPPGLDEATRRRQLDDLSRLNGWKLEEAGDPEITTRVAQYELAARMQTAVPELTDLSKEPDSVFELYGPDARRPGTFAYNCLLARRLAERGVRFIQLFHRGWDQHQQLPTQIRGQCRDTDQASAALVIDLKRRGLLEDTVVFWGGEFGRTVYGQGPFSADDYGRDHHPRCFTVWLAGGGTRRGMTHGETDDFGYNVTKDPVGVHDLNATILHCLGLDHARLTFRSQGRRFRLTDVHGEIVRGILA
jgi:hypothetical protein